MKEKLIHKTKPMSCYTYCDIDTYGNKSKPYSCNPKVKLTYYWKEVTCPKCKSHEQYMKMVSQESRGKQRAIDQILIMLDSKKIPGAHPSCNIKNAVIDEIINDVKITFRME